MAESQAMKVPKAFGIERNSGFTNILAFTLTFRVATTLTIVCSQSPLQRVITLVIISPKSLLINCLWVAIPVKPSKNYPIIAFKTSTPSKPDTETRVSITDQVLRVSIIES